MQRRKAEVCIFIILLLHPKTVITIFAQHPRALTLLISLQMEKLPQGLWPVMLTPFKENNELDLSGLVELTEFYLAAGADGLFANCLSSEMFQLTTEERYLVTKTVVDTVGGRVPVVATGSFGSDVATNAGFIERLHGAGAAAVVISTNQVVGQRESEEEFKSKIEELLGRTGSIPLGLYECPVPYKRLLSVDLVQWLAHSGRFYYHKDTSCDLEPIQKKIGAMRGTNLGLYNANTPTGLSSLRAGARGMSPIGANFYPELFAYLVHRGRSAPKDEKLIKLDALLSIFDAVIHRSYPFSAKLFLQKRGLRITLNSRIPVPPLAYEDQLKLDAIWHALNELAGELGINVLQVESL